MSHIWPHENEQFNYSGADFISLKCNSCFSQIDNDNVATPQCHRLTWWSMRCLCCCLQCVLSPSCRAERSLFLPSPPPPWTVTHKVTQMSNTGHKLMASQLIKKSVLLFYISVLFFFLYWTEWPHSHHHYILKLIMLGIFMIQSKLTNKVTRYPKVILIARWLHYQVTIKWVLRYYKKPITTFPQQTVGSA